METIFPIFYAIIFSCIISYCVDCIEMIHIELMFKNKRITFDEYYELCIILYENTSFCSLTNKLDNIFFNFRS